MTESPFYTPESTIAWLQKRQPITMRLKTLGNQMRVFMNPHDYQTMLDSAASRRGRLAMRIMGECSCRVDELPTLVRGKLRQSTHPDVDLWFWVILGKDTKDRDTEGKRREVWVPDSVVDDVEEYCEINGIGEDGSIFRCSKRTLQKEIERARDNAVGKTGNSDYGHVSCHDYRAYFATNMALREQVSEEIVMELGGWDDRKTFRQAYLDAQFDDIIAQHLAAADLIENEKLDSLSEYERLRNEIADLKMMIDDLDLSVNINGRMAQATVENVEDASLDRWNGGDGEE